ncbi:MAG: hypothetical protein IH886_08795 [Nitrospinae bacterium]|nr:hypothetical protein [Nitrospinota bacterium]
MGDLLALEVACPLGPTGEHLQVRAVGFPPVQVEVYLRDLGVAYQRDPAGDYLLVRGVVCQRDPAGDYLLVRGVVCQQGLVVVFQPVQPRI